MMTLRFEDEQDQWTIICSTDRDPEMKIQTVIYFDHGHMMIRQSLSTLMMRICHHFHHHHQMKNTDFCDRVLEIDHQVLRHTWNADGRDIVLTQEMMVWKGENQEILPWIIDTNEDLETG